MGPPVIPSLAGGHADTRLRAGSTRNWFALATCSALLAALAASPSAVIAAEPCPNEQVRAESNINPTTGAPFSAELPDCRAYELVSPPNTEGWEAPATMAASTIRHLVTPNRSVFFASQATPAGTGAIEDGHYIDTFRSRRTSTGWVTRDMTAFGSQGGGKSLQAAAIDGSAALISTPLTLSSEDLNNPTGNTSEGGDLYIVRETGAPEFVSHGTLPNSVETSDTVAGTIIANSDLSAVGFRTLVPISKEDPGTSEDCYVWQEVGPAPRLAALTNTAPSGEPNCEYLAVAADGRPIIREDPSSSSRIVAAGAVPSAVTVLAGAAASFDAMSPDDNIVYLSIPEAEAPVPNEDAGTDIYAINLALSTTDTPLVVTCISCAAAGVPNAGDATWVGQSADGSHVFFRLADGDLYVHDAAGSQLLAPAADELAQLHFSADGADLVALSPASLTPADTNEAPDIYELSVGAPAVLVTDGISTDSSYTPSAVSNDGDRVIFEAQAAGGPTTIDESVAGRTGQISPLGATRSYEVIGTAGPELEDVFFDANEPLVSQDENAGTTDIYDARVDGGFPAPSRAPLEATTPNPVAPVIAPYLPSTEPLTPGLAQLPADTATPPVASRAKPPSRAEKLAGALKTCARQKHKARKTQCEKTVRLRFAVKAKAKKTTEHRSR
jgi:hypothetical protein